MLARSEKPFPLCEPAVILNNSRTSIRSTELVGQNVAKIPLWRPTPVASRLVKPRKGVAGTKVPALIERAMWEGRIRPSEGVAGTQFRPSFSLAGYGEPSNPCATVGCYINNLFDWESGNGWSRIAVGFIGRSGGGLFGESLRGRGRGWGRAGPGIWSRRGRSRKGGRRGWTVGRS